MSSAADLNKSTCASPSTTCALHRLGLGQCAVVKNIQCDNQCLRNKLLSMGIVEGTSVRVTGIAPLGDPIRIGVLGCDVALRKSEAAHIFVEAAR